MDFTTARRWSVRSVNEQKLSQLQVQFAALASREQRREKAARLARSLGAEELLIFVPEPGLDALLPAPGFPQTLPEGREWHRFLSACVVSKRQQGVLSFPDRDIRKKAAGFYIEGGGVLVLLGGNPTEEIEMLLPLFPLLVSSIRGERAALAFAGQTQIARNSAAEARRLAEALDAARYHLEQALTEAQAASRIKSQLISVVSHELRTPLNAIIGYASLLRDPDLAGEGINPKEMLNRIENNALILLELINNLLDLSKIESGKMTLRINDFSLSRLLKEIVYNFGPMAEKKGLRLEMIDDPSAPEIRSDPGRLEQIFINLLSNAIKFTESGSVTVHLKHHPAERELSVAVSDTGIGIEESDLAFIFEPFYQSDASYTRVHEGTGLGLSIVKDLVELLGGRVDVISRPQVGTTFTVQLPYVLPDRPSQHV